MKRQNQFVHHFPAAVLACGLVASLLPGITAAREREGNPRRMVESPSVDSHALVATHAVASGAVSEDKTEVVLSQPDVSEIGDRLLVIERQPTETWFMISWQKSPFTAGGKFVTVDWDPGEKPGLSIRDEKARRTAQRGMRNVPRSSVCQMYGDTVGAYLNSADLSGKGVDADGNPLPGSEGFKQMVTPSYKFDPKAAVRPWSSPDSVLRVSLDLQIPTAVGAWIGQSGDNTVTHNDIGDLYYSAVSVGWTWGFGNSVAKRNNISYNHLHHLGQRRMSDLAGVYSLGISDGTVISHNVIHDVYCWGYGGWGLYPDEGSSNILFENNLVYNVTDGGFHQHYGRDNTVRNNILAFSEQEQVRGTAQKKAGDHLSFTFERNIVYFDQGELFGRDFQWGPDVQVNLKNNIYWRAGGQRFDFAGKSWDQWRAMGRDNEGSIIADPKFVDADNYDFRFASDEVIKQTGFKPFDYSQAGVYGAADWIALAKEWTYAPVGTPPVLR